MPATTPTPSNTLSSGQSPRDLFATSVIGDLSSSLKNNAPLDPQAVAGLATSVVASKPAVVTLSVAARPRFFRVSYGVDGTGQPAQRTFLDITNFADSRAAQEAMKTHLELFDQDPSSVCKKPDQRLGQAALQTGSSVFWVRDAVWVKLTAGSSVVPKAQQQKPSRQSQAPTSSVSQSTSTRSAVPTATTAPKIPDPTTVSPSALLTMLLNFAAAIDTHLAKAAVPASNQLKPNTAVTSTSYKGASGKTFSFRLVAATGTHDLKPSEVDNPRIVSPTRNGTADGEYSFVGKKPGKTKLHLIVVRADNLAVGTSDVSIEITEN